MNAWPQTLACCLLTLLLSQALAVSAQETEQPGGCAEDEVDMGDYCASLPPAMTEEEKQRRRVTRFRGKSMMPGRVEIPTDNTAEGSDTPGESSAPGAPVNGENPMPSLPPAVAGSKAVPPSAVTTPGSMVISGALQPEIAEKAIQAEPAKPAEATGPVNAKRPMDTGYVVQLGAFSSRSVAASVARDVHADGFPVALARLEAGERVLWASFAGPFEQIEEANSVRDQMRKTPRFANAWIKPAVNLPLIGPEDETIEE